MATPSQVHCAGIFPLLANAGTVMKAMGGHLHALEITRGALRG
jgi:hypothetical protein